MTEGTPQPVNGVLRSYEASGFPGRTQAQPRQPHGRGVGLLTAAQHLRALETGEAQLDVVVINLDRDVARLQHMEVQLRGAGLTYRRFSAIDGAKLPANLRSYFDPRCKTLSAGEIGCYASHLAICAEIVASASDAPTLILEDDIECPPFMKPVLDRVITALPDAWDIVRLSYPSKRAALRVATLVDGFELVRYSQAPVSTGAYLLSRSGATKLLTKRWRDIPIDHDLRRVWAWDLKTFGVSPPPVRADTLGASSIDAMGAGVRAQPWRSARIKRQRIWESAWRFVYGVKDFGAWRWCALEALNLFGRAAPRAQRARLLQWAQVRWGWSSASHAQGLRSALLHERAFDQAGCADRASLSPTLKRGGRS